jgi:nucleotide-binding universal stress UspA family protein
MFRHLLVPLDGSRLAEAALPAAAYLAQTLGASVTLVHIIERKAPQEIHGERHLADPDKACAYLDEVASRAFPADLRVERHVHTTEVGDVARSIVEHCCELGPDLIVMCTHGRHVPRDLLLGNIAQQVIALGTIPVLLIQPAEAEAMPPFACRLLLVPLDGNPTHEHGLPVAAGLARACAAALYLLVVVPTLSTLLRERAATGRLLPGATTVLLDLAQQDAEEHLRRQVAQLLAAGLSVTAEVCRGDPATTIVSTARRVGADLIVLGTHGKTGLDAFWSGSVAPRISSRSRVPLLLVPVRGPESEG